MAPATRMSGNFAASQSANIDHLLENFNQFKRKHITQNRDIIKTNALAQLRIKELEDKVLQLEGERAEKNLEMIRIRANMDRVERASKSMMRGFQLVGAGLAALTSIEGLRIAEPSERVEQEAKDILQSDAGQSKQSTRITLDPHTLPAGVARSVSRPPEAQLVNLMEEDSRELMSEERDAEEGIDTVEAAEGNGTMDETSRGGMEDETIHPEAIDRDLAAPVIKGTKRKSPSSETTHTVALPPNLSLSMPLSPQEVQATPSQLLTPSYGHSQLRHCTSVDSLSSFADEEEVQLSDDLCEEDDLLQPAAVPSIPKKGADDTQQRRFTKPLKRRESTMSPDRSNGSNESNMSNNRRELTPTELQLFSSSDGESPQVTRSSRRSSARDRKSINYALPKLNTKMRKPDPVDMIPAQAGERGRKESSSGEGSGDSRDETPRRTLRGGSEVASTGNLRELAMQHQSARRDEQRINPSEENQSSQYRPQARRRRSSSGQPPSRASPENERSNEWENDQSFNETSDLTFTGKEQFTNSLPSSWKNHPITSLSSNGQFPKSAINGTPIPKNHTGQNIKALKVANRIHKQSVTNQPSSLSSSDIARSKAHNRPATNTIVIGERVLNSSTKINQARIISPSNSDNSTKRNSLHAAMTLEVEGQ